MLKQIHPIAGFIGFLVILAFWTSTVLAELSGQAETILAVKTGILWGMILLIPSLAVAGGTGFRLAGPDAKGLAGTKKRRMPFIAANGLLVLVPCAVFLQRLAAADTYGTIFYAVQAVELVAGLVNLTLIGLNIRDGLRMTKRRRQRKAR